MTDIFTKGKRSEIMSKIKGKNTGIEKLGRKMLKKTSIKGFSSGDKVFGKPDIIFENKKVAIFLDGKFWHGYRFDDWKSKIPEFWRLKISKNISRDKKVNRKLRNDGWKVLRFWDIKIKKQPNKFVDRIKKVLNE
jgi:DNA mismatch endonuclease (patch repair protein)